MKRLTLGVGVGIAIGILASKACKAEQLSPESVLKKSESRC